MTWVDDDLAQAVIHLQQATVVVDRMWRATGRDGSTLSPGTGDDVVEAFGLGEASLAMHQALVALRAGDEHRRRRGPVPVVPVARYAAETSGGALSEAASATTG